MAATATLDHVDGSQVELSGNSAEYAVRIGHVEGLPTTGSPEDVLWAATNAAGMPATGELYPGRTNCFLTRIQVFGISADKANVRLIYEPFEGVGSSLVIDVSSSMSTYQTNMMPGTKELFSIDFVTATEGGQDIPVDYVTLGLLRPIRRIAVTQLVNGTLDIEQATGFAENVGKVNDATWCDKPKGAWLITGANATISRYGGYYQTRLEAISQGDDLWSYYSIMRSQITGRIAGGTPGGDDDIQSTLDYLKSLEYSTRTYFPAQGRGCFRVDPYETDDFNTIFGFGAEPEVP